MTMTLDEIGKGTVQQWKDTGVVTSTSIGVLGVIKVQNAAGVVGIQVKNTDSSNAFNAFDVYLRATKDSDWVLHAETTAKFTSAIKLPLVDASGTPVTLAANSNVLLRYECGGLDAIRVRVAHATGAGTANLFATFHANR